MKKLVSFVVFVSLFVGASLASATENHCPNGSVVVNGPGGHKCVFTGEKGEKGEKGDTGAKGDTGTVDTTLLTTEVSRIDSVNFYQDTRLSNLEADVERLDGGVALAIAASSHQYDVNHNGMQGSMSTGFYNGQMALSLGIGGKIDSNAFVNVNVSHSFKGTGVGAGLSVKF